MSTQHEHAIGAGGLLLAEITSGSAAAHFLSEIPPWLGGALTALFVGITLRALDPTLRRVGEHLAARVSAPPGPDSTPPEGRPTVAPPEPPAPRPRVVTRRVRHPDDPETGRARVLLLVVLLAGCGFFAASPVARPGNTAPDLLKKISAGAHEVCDPILAALDGAIASYNPPQPAAVVVAKDASADSDASEGGAP